VLIVDDVHLLAQKGATQEEFFHTFNALHTGGKQMVFSANAPPQLLSAIEARLISRFEWGILLPLEPLSQAEMRTMLETKMRVTKFPLRKEVVDFLLTSFKSSSKTLHSALDALILRSHLHYNKDPRLLDLESVHLLLKDLIEKENATVVTPSKIVRAVADFYGIRVDDILGKSQTRECALPRQIAMHLCRSQLKMPYIKIGEFFQRDHSTVMTSVKQIKKEIETQQHEISSSLSEILRNLMTAKQ
jgi:chromosomal replication initiator protein